MELSPNKARLQGGRGWGRSLPVALLLVSVVCASLPAQLPPQGGEPPKPVIAAPMGVELARHLLSRTGFGAEPSRVQEFALLTYESAVDRLLKEVASPLATPLPSWVASRSEDVKADAERNEKRKQQRRRVEELRGWWLQEMVATSSPLTEHLTLFWSNHFTTSARKVRAARLLQKQNALLRKHALGNFKQFVQEVAKDPAMLIFLDTVRNRRQKPNENFARELLELFTLGEGHYTEQDIKEAARAFTGWRIRRDKGEFNFVRRQHDSGLKTFMGKTGRFNGDDIIDIVFEKPEVSHWVVRKLWLEFVSPTVVPSELHKIAEVFRESGYELKPTFRALLLTPSFRDVELRGQLIKSPVDFLVGTLRTFGVDPQEPARLVRGLRQLEQDLLNPPNVKGWPGGSAWITTTTLLNRNELALRLVDGQQRERKRRRPRKGKATSKPRSMMQNRIASWYQALPGDSPEARNSFATTLLLPVAPFDEVVATSDPVKMVRALILDPTYQLK